MKLLKVLNEDLTSPFQRFQFEIDKEYVCDDFDKSSDECSRGFYAIDFNGLSYSLNKDGKKHSVFEVEVSGKSKEFNQFKRRYEKMIILRQLTEEEIKDGLTACCESEGYNVLESCYPVNPFKVEPSITVEEAVVFLNLWRKVRDSVGSSVWSSVWDSVWDSVGGSVRDSVGDSVRSSVWDSVWGSVGGSVGSSVLSSVWGSVWGYYSSLFPIRKWKYIDHEEGVNPFQPAIDLWRAGYVASFDGRKWRLHTKDGIVWEEV
jgi:hypothetical protein